MTLRDALRKRTSSLSPLSALDIEALQSFPAPVYLPVGGKSHPRFTLAAHWLGSLFPRSWVDIYQDQTHIEAPPIRETERFTCALRMLREGLA